ncbi:MAG: hypothetical protein Q8L74_08135 [Nitrospirota bacterium]|nr:hypothetical protein [Nitrospirota bacterium]
MEAQTAVAHVLPPSTELAAPDQEAVPGSTAPASGGSPTTHVLRVVDFMSDTLYGWRRFLTLNVLMKGCEKVGFYPISTDG